MPFIERVKALFSRKGDAEKKIAFLAERRAALCQQRDRAYEDMTLLEKQETDLTEQFRNAAGTISKRRITSQLLQLRKDVDRRQQLLSMLNQQVNIVSTHLHNLELVQQGQVASLPNTEEMTADAVKAEEVLAELESSAELAGSVGPVASATMSPEEQALYDELERRTAAPAPAAPAEAPAKAPPATEAPEAHEPETAPAEPLPQQTAGAPQPSEPEPG